MVADPANIITKAVGITVAISFAAMLVAALWEEKLPRITSDKQEQKKADVSKMLKHTEEMLRIWLVEEDKEKMLKHFLILTPREQALFLIVLNDVVTQSENEEFRQAAKDIPEYIKSAL